jgi:hypothetical protein
VLAASIIVLMMEAASTSQTMVNFYQTTWHNNRADSHLRTCCREILNFTMKMQIMPVSNVVIFKVLRLFKKQTMDRIS